MCGDDSLVIRSIGLCIARGERSRPCATSLRHHTSASEHAGVDLNSTSELSDFRLGATVSLPLGKTQSLKFSCSKGIYIRYGGNYQNVSIAGQYAWLGKRS